MPRYEPVSNDDSAPTSPTISTRRSSLASLRRSSLSFRRPTQRTTLIPDPEEMDAAFDGPDEPDEEDRLIGSRENPGRIPGDYDFERDYVGSYSS